MIRRLTLTACLIVARALPALAQTHSGSHDQAYPHGPGHMPMDSAMHSLLHGSWTGTITSYQGISTGVVMSVTHDSMRRIALSMRADRAIRVGAATDVVLNGDKLQWTQDLAGAPCKATAILSSPTRVAQETISGRLACSDRPMTFALRKKTE